MINRYLIVPDDELDSDAGVKLHHLHNVSISFENAKQSRQTHVKSDLRPRFFHSSSSSRPCTYI